MTKNANRTKSGSYADAVNEYVNSVLGKPKRKSGENGIHLRNVPDDVKGIILKKQGVMKAEKKRGQLPQEDAVYAIVREYAKLQSLTDKKKTNG